MIMVSEVHQLDALGLIISGSFKTSTVASDTSWSGNSAEVTQTLAHEPALSIHVQTPTNMLDCLLLSYYW